MYKGMYVYVLQGQGPHGKDTDDDTCEYEEQGDINRTEPHSGQGEILHHVDAAAWGVDAR